MKLFLTSLALATTTLTLLICGAGPANAQHDGSQSLCKPTKVKGGTKLCGPATAQISAFPGVIFRHGSCIVTNKSGSRDFTLELGQLTYINPAKNGGLAYLHLTITGPLSHPTGGYIIAYWHSKRWSGIGVSFHGNATKGTFVLQGSNPTPGRVTGSYHC